MDRFIVVRVKTRFYIKTFKIQYGQIYRRQADMQASLEWHLKSNMDRFIGVACSAFNGIFVDLKSNMDRFIAMLTT